MQTIDEFIINWLNHFTPDPNIFSSLMVLIWDNDLLKGAVLVAVLWYLWFSNNNKMSHVQEKILISLIACFIAIIVGRALALLLPFRDRPVLNPNIHVITHVQNGLSDWSSFPSDHAVMFFSLATGFYLISKRIGILSYLYILAIICFPRIYLGLHYPSDIIAGAFVGILITWLISLQKISQTIIKRIIEFSFKYPGVFYSLFFLLTFQIATLFDESRLLGSFFLHKFEKLINMIL